MNSKSILTILQYNIMKSRGKVIATLLKDIKIQKFDIIIIQKL